MSLGGAEQKLARRISKYPELLPYVAASRWPDLNKLKTNENKTKPKTSGKCLDSNNWKQTATATTNLATWLDATN